MLDADCWEIWKGDGQCDDMNNNETCGYDGGDCCEGNVFLDDPLFPIHRVKKYCLNCECLGNHRVPGSEK